MLNLTHAIHRASGYVLVPPSDAQVPTGDAVPDPAAAGSAWPNAHALLSSAMGPRFGLRGNAREVQERWVDARDEWDAYERAQWRREGEALRRAEAVVGVDVEMQKLDLRIREMEGP